MRRDDEAPAVSHPGNLTPSQQMGGQPITHLQRSFKGPEESLSEGAFGPHQPAGTLSRCITGPRGVHVRGLQWDAWKSTLMFTPGRLLGPQAGVGKGGAPPVTGLLQGRSHHNTCHRAAPATSLGWSRGGAPGGSQWFEPLKAPRVRCIGQSQEPEGS